MQVYLIRETKKVESGQLFMNLYQLFAASTQRNQPRGHLLKMNNFLNITTIKVTISLKQPGGLLPGKLFRKGQMYKTDRQEHH